MPRASAPRAPVPGLPDLPDDVLLRILAGVPLKDRLRGAALVCRRLCQLSCEPSLLGSCTVSVHSLVALRALLPWLAQHAACMQRLDLFVQHSWSANAEAAMEGGEGGALVAACATACGTAGQLRHLRIGSIVPLATLAWLPCMRSLERLEIDLHSGSLTLSADARGLTALRSLALRAELLRLEAGARLPPCLTHLRLVDGQGTNMPPQVGQLSNLRSLSLTCKYAMFSMARLALLTGLTSLATDWCQHCPPPAALARLSRLRRLRLDGPDFLPVHLHLPALQQLTYLAVATSLPVPPAVAALHQLRQLWWWRRSDDRSPALPRALPHPHSLQQLEFLATNWPMAAASTPALASMPALQQLWLADPLDHTAVPPATWRQFWCWVHVHPPLRLLRWAADMRQPRTGVDFDRPDLVQRIERGRTFFCHAFNEV